MEENKDRIREEGLALFIISDNTNDIYYERYLPPRILKNKNLASRVLSLRNILIIMTIIEIIASIWGFSYYFIRRSLIYVFINVSLFLLAILGVYAVLVVQEICLMIYALFITSLPGTFFIYQIFEFFAINDTKRGVNARLNDNMLLLIFSIPYIYDFIVGIMTIVLLWRISEFNESIKHLKENDESEKLLKEQNDQIKKKYSAEKLSNIFKERENSNSCVICLDANREILCYPCGHLLLCNQCKSTYEGSFIFGNASCPVCRTQIEKFITVRNV